jgi:hypothetical protein
MNDELDDEELEQKHSDRYHHGVYREHQFQTAISRVLDRAGVDHETEYVVGDDEQTELDENGRRCDIYIPELDAAIELKLDPNIRGVGQCAYYSRFCAEVVMMFSGPKIADSHSPDVQGTLRQVSDVSYVGCIPKMTDGTLRLITSSDSRFVYEAAHGDLGNYDFADVAYAGPPSAPWPEEYDEESRLPGGRIVYDQW